MNVAHDIDPGAVVDALVVVLIAMAGEIIVRRVVVSEDNACWQNVLLDDREKCGLLSVNRHDSFHPPFPLNHSKDGCLGLRGLSEALGCRPDPGFVDLNAVSLQL